MDAAQHTFEAWLASLLAERLEDASIEFVVRNVGDVRRQYVPVHSLALGHFRFAYVSVCVEVNLSLDSLLELAFPSTSSIIFHCCFLAFNRHTQQWHKERQKV